MAAWLRREHEVYAVLEGSFIPGSRGGTTTGRGRCSRSRI